MAVNVQQRHPSGTDPSTDLYVEQGQHVEVKDGTLEVLDAQDGRRVAVFAAGTWLSAQVDD